MLKLLLLSLLPRLTPDAALLQARHRLFSFLGHTRKRRAPDLELMLRREVGLPEQPALLVRHSGHQFTVTADLQTVGIDSLQIGITPKQFTLSGWVLQEPSHASTTGVSPECGWFSSSRAIPPSMDLDHFTLHYRQGQLIFSVPKQHSRKWHLMHTPASTTEYHQ
ncbi:hypothetical protein [Pseudomonas sp. BBP2017]|uniref:hypothetical protein n=1 Tax=Pseudomonas sp. BBP2017 TaxID=2109731 RepID=UPI000D119B9B|nr:hypothetical protein [Pseudomonas sp. BBP2017]